MERLLLIDCPALADPEGGAGSGEGAGGGEPGDSAHHLRQLARVVDALSELCPWVDPVRPGVCALPMRGPARYFGGEAEVLARVGGRVAEVLGGEEEGGPRLGVAEGIFAAALSARVGVVVAPGATPDFLAGWPVEVLGTAELCEVLPRLGLYTLGALAALPTREVLARFGTIGVRGQRLARGLEGELPGYRTPDLATRLAALAYGVPLRNHQPGFWGGTSAADERAAEVLTTLQRQLGPETVVVAEPAEGRGPEDRVRFVTWRADAASRSGTAAGPWPGRLPPPAPARVAPSARPHPAELVDGTGAAVGVTARGVLTTRPVRLSVAGGPWIELTGWSAPWPVEERWWSRARRRSVRLQVTTATGEAHLLMVERGRWRVAATYD
ncbi:MAG TPA: hypothetical protein VMB82_09295 [Acidimicrobiales bacterium]|nr:hypothetical protein [Acidimicrobiales bacterium]